MTDQTLEVAAIISVCRATKTLCERFNDYLETCQRLESQIGRELLDIGKKFIEALLLTNEFVLEVKSEIGAYVKILKQYMQSLDHHKGTDWPKPPDYGKFRSKGMKLYKQCMDINVESKKNAYRN